MYLLYVCKPVTGIQVCKAAWRLVYLWLFLLSASCYLQLFDVGGYRVVEMHLQPLHFCLELHLFLLHACHPVFRHLGLSLLLSHLGLSKEHLPALSSSPNNDPSAAGSCLNPSVTCSVLTTHSLSYL